jgi:SAM-dependent methyltransferase
MLHNLTRRSASIPRRLLSERRPHLVPLYWLLRTSDLAREGMENSASFRFADHIYVGSASGRGTIGWSVDRLLLSLPSARSFRNRFVHARDEVLEAIRGSCRERIEVLSAPSGIARELIEAALSLRRSDPPRLARVRFHCLDFDPAPLAETRAAVDRLGLANFAFHRGDALDPAAYPPSLDVITSTGLAEFLPEPSLLQFYRLCVQRLRPGGQLITSATVRHRVSAFLMEHLAELTARYRDEADVARIFASIPEAEASWCRDQAGYQILIKARRRTLPA